MIPSFAAELLYATAQREADQLQCHFPTSTVTVLDVEGPWDDLTSNPVHLRDIARVSDEQATGCARR